ncbi:MAG TPA: hypothetical protein VGN26_00340, partial [Armatimonadota bacterium]
MSRLWRALLVPIAVAAACSLARPSWSQGVDAPAMPPEDSGAQSYYLDFRNSPYYLPARIAVTGSVPKPGSYA